MLYHIVMSVRVLGGVLICLLVVAGILFAGMSLSNSRDADKHAEMKLDTARMKRGLPIIVTLAVASVLFVLSIAIGA